MRGLDGSSALVTGASRGIGEAVARSLRAAGANVHLLARSVARLEELGLELGAEVVPCDLTDPESLRDATQEIRRRLGGAPDILANCAGVFDIAPVHEVTHDSLKANLAGNLEAPFMLVRTILPDMLERGSGLIVSVGSVAGRRAFPGNAAYSASKFGLRGFHEVLREETRGTGVRVSLVEPGAVDTSIWDPIGPDADPHLPNRTDMLSARDVAEAITFIALQRDTVVIPVLQVERA